MDPTNRCQLLTFCLAFLFPRLALSPGSPLPLPDPEVTPSSWPVIGFLSYLLSNQWGENSITIAVFWKLILRPRDKYSFHFTSENHLSEANSSYLKQENRYWQSKMPLNCLLKSQNTESELSEPAKGWFSLCTHPLAENIPIGLEERDYVSCPRKRRRKRKINNREKPNILVENIHMSGFRKQQRSWLLPS